MLTTKLQSRAIKNSRSAMYCSLQCWPASHQII